MGRDLRHLTQGGGQVGDRPNDLQVRLRLEQPAEPLRQEGLPVTGTTRKGREG